jgi:hypothetical protein
MRLRIDSLGMGEEQLQHQRTRRFSEGMDAGRVAGPIARVLARLGASVSALLSTPAHRTGMAILGASSDFQRAPAYLAERLVRWLTPGRPGRNPPCRPPVSPS